MKTYNLIGEGLKVLVFWSDIDNIQKATLAQNELVKITEVYQVDIDLDDCDNVLRVECHPDCSPKLIEGHISELGFKSREFRDY